jgi:hypothetical protein
MVFTFIAGIAVGVAATYKVAETKYRNIADEEIESVIERFEGRKPMIQKEYDEDDSRESAVQEEEDKEDSNSQVEPDRFSVTKNSMKEYKSTVNRTGYDKISEQTSKPTKGGKKKKDAIEEVKPVEEHDNNIYVIRPDEFNTLDGYRVETLYYSSDNYLLDSNYHEVSDYDMTRTIGHDPYGNFGEYEDDSVYVRNDDLMCDYEILLSEKKFSEIVEA